MRNISHISGIRLIARLHFNRSDSGIAAESFLTGRCPMLRSKILAVPFVLLLGALGGWLVSSGRLTTFAQDNKTKGETSSQRGTPLVLPRPDFHFPGNVGRTILDSDKPQFPQPTQAPKGA